ncbi:MAG: tetratricopeptide repeat protein [Candidatus Aureabacteria bacterium]|nr:tetratricopeptide repeat protein [Candidatus Auribacterota bacterium]
MIKRIFFIISTVGFLFSALAEPSKMYYKRAQDAENPEDKIKFYTMTLKMNPQFSAALFERAQTYFEMNKLEETENDIRLYLEKFPPSPEVHVLKGRIAQRLGDLDTADEEYDNAIKITPAHDEANFRKGLLLVLQAKLKQHPEYYHKAIPYLLTVQQRSPYAISSFSQAAKCYEIESKYDEAQKLYVNLSSQEPDNALFAFNAGRLYYMNGDNETAIKYLNSACELTFKDQSFEIYYAVFRYFFTIYKLRDLTSANYQLNRFLDKLPPTPLAELFQNKITGEEFLKKASQKKDSKMPEQLEKILACEAHSALGYYYLLKDKNDEAISCFKNAIIHELYGLPYYHLAKFEFQRLSLLKEINAMEFNDKETELPDIPLEQSEAENTMATEAPPAAHSDEKE